MYIPNYYSPLLTSHNHIEELSIASGKLSTKYGQYNIGTCYDLKKSHVARESHVTLLFITLLV